MTAAALWPADAVERVSIEELTPYERNSRTHSDEQVQQLMKSMLEFGFTMPILRDEHGNVIAGHGRIAAASRLVADGHPEFSMLPCMTATNWSDTQKRAYVLADNKLAMNAGWDNELLAAEIQDLMAEDFDATLLGFSDAEIEALLPSEVNDLDAPNDFQPEGEGESATGTGNNLMKFGSKTVPVSEDEVERLTDMLDRYVNDHGVAYGFVGALCDCAIAGNF